MVPRFIYFSFLDACHVNFASPGKLCRRLVARSHDSEHVVSDMYFSNAVSLLLVLSIWKLRLRVIFAYKCH